MSKKDITNIEKKVFSNFYSIQEAIKELCKVECEVFYIFESQDNFIEGCFNGDKFTVYYEEYKGQLLITEVLTFY